MPFESVFEDYPDATSLDGGGQKEVYRITHPDHGEAVLKIGSYSGRRDLERIQREVDTLNAIDSDLYPDNYQFRVNEDEKIFVIVEEWIDSVPLSEAWDRFTSPVEKLRFIRRLSEGLSILWDRHIVHRDVKPGNVLVEPDGVPVIIDLGIARLLEMESLTRTLAALGPCTPFYAAPEQLRNRKPKIDWRTDQFNIGILLVQLFLNGSHPFNPDVVGEGDRIDQNLLNGVWHYAPLQTDELEPVFELADRMLGDEPFKRFRRPGTFFNSLEETINHFA